jgi:hypothetical protein
MSLAEPGFRRRDPYRGPSGRGRRLQGWQGQPRAHPMRAGHTLVQAGLLDSSGLPVVGSEQAEAPLDQDRPQNELFDNGA